jgi:hypothetical protein
MHNQKAPSGAFFFAAASGGWSKMLLAMAVLLSRRLYIVIRLDADLPFLALTPN